MKDLLKDAIFIAITVLIIFAGCSKSVLIDIDKRIVTKADTTEYTPRVKADTTEVEDTLVPITFSVTVDDWEEIDWN